MSELPYITGIFSASMTVFSTAVVLLLVQDDMSVVFAGLLSSIISNSLSDGLSVTSGGDQSAETFLKVSSAEIVLGVPFLIVILIFTFRQRNTKIKRLTFGPARNNGTKLKLTRTDRVVIIGILAVINALFLTSVLIWSINTDWDARVVLLIPVVILLTTLITYYTEKGLFDKRARTVATR